MQYSAAFDIYKGQTATMKRASGPRIVMDQEFVPWRELRLKIKRKERIIIFAKC